MENKYLIALDISSMNVGYAIFKEAALFLYGNIKLTKAKKVEFVNKLKNDLDIITNELIKIISKINNDKKDESDIYLITEYSYFAAKAFKGMDKIVFYNGIVTAITALLAENKIQIKQIKPKQWQKIMELNSLDFITIEMNQKEKSIKNASVIANKQIKNDNTADAICIGFFGGGIYDKSFN